MAEGVGFEPTLGLPLSLISSQVPSTAQPPFRALIIKHLQVPHPLQYASNGNYYGRIRVSGKLIREAPSESVPGPAITVQAPLHP